MDTNIRVKSLERTLRADGFVGVYLQTGSRTPARSFYEKSGYEVFDVLSLRKNLRAQL